MVRLIAVASKRAPHGETTLPYLAAVLFVLVFVAWPLVDVGLLMRPLLGMVFLVISLTGLYVLSAPGRFVPVVLTLGGIVFALQMTMLVWPSDTAAILNEVAAQLFVLALCGVLSSRVMGPGRVTPNRIVGAVVDSEAVDRQVRSVDLPLPDTYPRRLFTASYVLSIRYLAPQHDTAMIYLRFLLTNS